MQKTHTRLLSITLKNNMKQQCTIGLSTRKECTHTYRTYQAYLDLLMSGCVTCCSHPLATEPPSRHTADEWQVSNFIQDAKL